MKKIVSLLLSALMLVSVVSGMSINAYAENNYSIKGLGTVTVTVKPDEAAYITFIPEETCEYYIHSVSNEDPWAGLSVLEDDNYSEVAYNDDTDGLEFAVYYNCEKGKTYRLETYMYCEKDESYDVVFEKSNIKGVNFYKAKVNSVKEFSQGSITTDENGKEFFEYNVHSFIFAKGDKVTVNYTDGTKKEFVAQEEEYIDENGKKVTYTDFYDKDGRLLNYFIFDDQYINHWKVGRHYADLELYGRTIKVPVDIVERGWYKKSNKWHYMRNGADLKWRQKIGGKYYYFNGAGVMMTGWIKGKVWMYGKSDGSLATGWQKVGGKWYYFKADGSMTTGWQKVGGKWYYMNSSGAMTTGWQKVGGKWYYMNSSGAMTTGWQKIGGKWYYLESSGAMRTANLKQGGKTYRFNSSGACINP